MSAKERAETLKPNLFPQAKQNVFLRCPADIVIYGGAAGSGKSFALLLCPLRWIDMRDFGAVIFRRTYPEITNEGGLWDTSLGLYGSLFNPPVPKVGDLMWTFPSGARVSFRHLQYDETTQDYQGSQIPLIEYDQLEAFTEYQFMFMLARNRSMCGAPARIRGTANPQPGWLSEFLSWWISDDGYADMSRAGVVRWMVRQGNRIAWGDTRAEMIRQHGPGTEPKSVTFIPASVFDNPALLKSNPQYVANLKALPTTERERLLGDAKRGGNWHIRPGGVLFQRHWFGVVDELPADMERWVRYWDVAATMTDDEHPNPDWTASACMGVRRGQFFVRDVRRLRAKPQGVESQVAQCAALDGQLCPIWFEQEPGSAGIHMISMYQRGILAGYSVGADKVSKAKVERAAPLASAAQAGNVYLLRGAWNAALLDELESFGPGCEHDDQVDCVAGAHRKLSEPQLIGVMGKTGAI